MKTKKVLSLALALTLMSTTMLAGCSDTTQPSQSTASQEESSAASQEESSAAPQEDSSAASQEEPGGTVKILTAVTGGKDDEEMLLFAAELSEKTGLEVIMEKPSDYDNTMVQKLQSGEQYDLIYLGHKQLITLQEQGALLDITDRVNNSDIMMNNIDPQEWADIAVDGRYYAGLNKKEVFIPVAANAVHLREAGIDPDTIEPTLDGYYEVFQKLKETFPEKDYYPYNVILSENWDLQPWMAAVGLKGGVYEDSDGKLYAPYSTDDAAPVWEWLKKLYGEGLLDPACAVDKTSDMRAKMGASSQLTSICADWLAWIGLHNANAAAEDISTEDFEIIALPGIQAPDGDYMIRKGNASLWGIPVNAENPDGAFKVLEFFATQEGGVLLTAGVEGHDYTINNGVMELTETGASHSKDHGAPFPIYKDFAADLGYNPGVEDGLQYLNYASIERPLLMETEYKEIVGKWAVQIVRGDVAVLDGLEKMRAELVSRGVTEK